MEMNLAYYEATIAHLQSKGFVIESKQNVQQAQGEMAFDRTSNACTKGEDCCFSFEALRYPDGREDFYLEIQKVGKMRSFSFPLDSWKYHPNRIEFKYRYDPATGLGLAITLDLT